MMMEHQAMCANQRHAMHERVGIGSVVSQSFIQFNIFVVVRNYTVAVGVKILRMLCHSVHVQIPP